VSADFWLLAVQYFGPNPWPVLASILTHLFAGAFHTTNATLSTKVLKERPDLRDNKFIWFFLISNAVCALGRAWAVFGMTVENHSPSPTMQLISSLLSILALGSLWFLIPTAIKLPSFAKIDALNRQLEQKIQELKIEKDEKERAQTHLLQSQKMEAVGQLTGGIAHDFNNLVQAISGSLELISSNPHSDRVPRWVGVGIEAISRASHLTAQLLTFSRNQKLQIKEVELAPVIMNVRQLITRTIGPDIQISTSNITDVVVRTDPVQLELAILNLAVNARDAMPEGGSLTISTIIENDEVEINVTDTGIGIPADVAARVFEPFFTTKDIGKGTGLGLSMVYGLANQSGGDVYIKKTSEKGTTITISLPVVKNAAIFQEEVVAGNLIQMCEAKNILLVDDDPGVRETLSEILTLLGHHVKTAVDGMDALVYLKDNRPDLVVIDYAMPVMNGAQVIRSAKLLHPDLEVVFVTGFSDSAELEGYTVLKKPFKIGEIRQILQKIFHCTSSY
jgi:signal transduction histidine kinase/CheY-like chemotaxis protein